MYNSQYQYTHDIDWFFMNGKMPIHVASNGGLLPNNIYKAIDLQNLQTKVEAMIPTSRFQLNSNAIEYYVRRNYDNLDDEFFENLEFPAYPKDIDFPEDTPSWLKAYAWSFAKMAQRGFYSFDRDVNTGQYFLVAMPTLEVLMPEDVQNLMYKLPVEYAMGIVPYSNSQIKQYRIVSSIDSYERLKNGKNNRM